MRRHGAQSGMEERPVAQKTVTYSAVLGWLVANTNTKWAENWKAEDKLPDTAWLVMDLFDMPVERLVEGCTERGVGLRSYSLLSSDGTDGKHGGHDFFPPSADGAEGAQDDEGDGGRLASHAAFSSRDSTISACAARSAVFASKQNRRGSIAVEGRAC